MFMQQNLKDQQNIVKEIDDYLESTIQLNKDIKIQECNCQLVYLKEQAQSNEWIKTELSSLQRQKIFVKSDDKSLTFRQEGDTQNVIFEMYYSIRQYASSQLAKDVLIRFLNTKSIQVKETKKHDLDLINNDNKQIRVVLADDEIQSLDDNKKYEQEIKSKINFLLEHQKREMLLQEVKKEKEDAAKVNQELQKKNNEQNEKLKTLTKEKLEQDKKIKQLETELTASKKLNQTDKKDLVDQVEMISKKLADITGQLKKMDDQAKILRTEKDSLTKETTEQKKKIEALDTEVKQLREWKATHTVMIDRLESANLEHQYNLLDNQKENILLRRKIETYEKFYQDNIITIKKYQEDKDKKEQLASFS